MTVGQRIAQKRKELGLSQEALGEQLGVSRQAIYKWESDTTLPEIEKLIALSRIFSVPVGWLLGVEEAAPEYSDSGELNETQMQMVKEIVDGYLAAQPVPEPQKRRRWPWVVAIAACLAIIVSLFSLSEQLRSLDNQTHYLQSTMQMLENSMANQIGSITGRVEDILKSQNDLTADYSTEVVSIDPATDMATFSWRVVPKTYQPGMQAWIDIENGPGARITYGPYDPVREVFSGEFTVGLTDSTAIYIVFEYGGVRQTQLLDTYEKLYRYSFPRLNFHCQPLSFCIDESTGTLTEDLTIHMINEYYYNDTNSKIADYRFGLFADQKLVAWFTPDTHTVNYINDDKSVTKVQEQYFRLPPDGITLDQNRVYCVAAVVTDEYGREFIMQECPTRYEAGSGWTSGGSYESGPFFEGWTY